MVDYDRVIWTRVEHIVGDAHQCLYYILVWFASGPTVRGFEFVVSQY